MKICKKICRVLLIAAFWISVWWVGALWFAKPLLFPTPPTVLKSLWMLLGKPTFYRAVFYSLWNVMSGLLIATLLAVLTAALTYKLRFARDLLLPLMAVIKATPVASFIVLFWLFIGAAKVPSLIAGLIVFPVVWTNLDQGLQKIDTGLREVATVYRFSPFKRLRLLVLPSVKPYFISACRTSLGLAFKAGIAAEILTRPRNTVGTSIAVAKDYIEAPDMFAWTLTVILLSLLLEAAVMLLLRVIDRRPTGKGGTYDA